MKTKSFVKITFIAALMALVMLAIFVLPRLGFPIKVYAQTAEAQENLQVDTNTFLDMRQSAKYDPKLSFEEKEKLFVDWNFQHPAKESENFNIIQFDRVGELKDTRYDTTLQEESKAIQLNKNGNNEIVGPKITETSTLTFFTYGQGASLSHWSNNGWRLADKVSNEEK